MMSKMIVLVRTNFSILRRQRGLLIASLGLAIVSMLVFGFLFGGNTTNKTRLGVVDQDATTVSTQIVHQLQQSSSLQVFTGGRDEEQQELQNGQRDTRILLPPGVNQQPVKGGAQLQDHHAHDKPPN